MKPELKDITVAISTYEERVHNALELAKSFDELNMRVLVIHQAKSSVSHLDPLLLSGQVKNIEYAYLRSVGVTLSRNRAIELCRTKYLWFMDDDVKIDLNEVHQITSVNCEYLAAFTLRIKDESGTLRKNYPKHGKTITRRDSLSIGTIELIINVDFVRRNKIVFPPNMGAGSNLPVGDEAVFVSSIIRNKGLIKHFSATPLIHPTESSGTLGGQRNVVSKGFMLRQVYGWKGAGALLYLMFKLKGEKRLNIVKWLLKGFMR